MQGFVLDLVVFEVKHYNMGDAKGVKLITLGSKHVDNNNAFGTSITETAVQSYDELRYLRSCEHHLPARFKATGQMGVKKDKNNNNVATIIVSNLEFIEPLQLTAVEPLTNKATAGVAK